jgi:hypothetical protein
MLQTVTLFYIHCARACVRQGVRRGVVLFKNELICVFFVESELRLVNRLKPSSSVLQYCIHSLGSMPSSSALIPMYMGLIMWTYVQ